MGRNRRKTILLLNKFNVEWLNLDQNQIDVEFIFGLFVDSCIHFGGNDTLLAAGRKYGAEATTFFQIKEAFCVTSENVKNVWVIFQQQCSLSKQ